MRSQRGSASLNILLVILVLIAGGIVYVLSMGRKGDTGRHIGIDSPMRITEEVVNTAGGAGAGFDDGLPRRAAAVTEYELDEFGAGIAREEVFWIDINDDGLKDKITRTRIESGTDHYSDEYKIELRRGDEYIDVTPPELYTVEGAECSLQKIKFVIRPSFQIIKVARPWQDSWTTPSQAHKTVYSYPGNTWRIVESLPLGSVCDVSVLVNENPF